MIAWIVLIVLFIVILVSLFFLFYDKIQYLYEKKKHRKRIYKILHYFAEEEDCYLLNDVKVFLAKDDPEPTCFDHLLFAEKYIYIITDFIAFGGVYGNVKDVSLFLKKPSGKTVPIPNPIISGKERVRRIEEFINSAHEHKLFMSMTVYNPSLIVPKGIHIKDGESNFISVKELEETLRSAEKDNVKPMKDEKTKKLVELLLERSNEIKRSVQNKKKRKR